MSKALWQLTQVTTIDSTDLLYILRDPVTGKLDRAITGANLVAALAGAAHNHDNLYFTESEVTTLLLGYSLTGHTHSPPAAGNLDSLTDVIITAPSNTQVLKYNGTNWVNAADAGGGGGALDDLTDVIITAAALGDFLRFDGTNWVDAPLDVDLMTFALPANTTISTFGATLVDDANAAAALATLGLDADIATLALPASTTISTFGASLIDDAAAVNALATLGLDTDIATLVLPASTTISAFGATLIDDAAASNARTTLGLVIGTDVAAQIHTHTSLKERDYSVGGTLIVSTGVLRMYFKRAVTVTNVMASANTAPTGADIIIDVNKNGTTIFTGGTNRPQIAATTNVDLTAVPAVTAVAAGDYLTFDIDQIGSTIAGANLTVTVEFTESIT